MSCIDKHDKSALELIGEQYGREIQFSRPVASSSIEVDVSDEYDMAIFLVSTDIQPAPIRDPYDVDPYDVDPYDV
jgi:hypothetical protein